MEVLSIVTGEAGAMHGRSGLLHHDHGRQQGRGTLSISCKGLSVSAAADDLSLRCAGGADTLQLAGTATGEVRVGVRVRLSLAGDAARAKASYEAVEGHAAAATHNVWM
jgi:hypothetical protein